MQTQTCPIGFIEPKNNIPELARKLKQEHRTNPFTLVIDLSKGKISDLLGPTLAEIPIWKKFGMSRIRQAAKVDLPTSGHLLSHNQAEIKANLENHNLTHILILDDTSFSGTTSFIVENILKEAFPKKTIFVTHGFLILNTGKLGSNPGAKSRLEKRGSKALSGLEMSTPRDDGWHFFDLVNQKNLSDHFLAIRELLNFLREPNAQHLISAFLADEKILELIFPKIWSTKELEEKKQTGHFLGKGKLNGNFHVRNPQLLPNIIGQKHLLPIDQWQGSPEEAFALLIRLKEILKKGIK